MKNTQIQISETLSLTENNDTPAAPIVVIPATSPIPTASPNASGTTDSDGYCEVIRTHFSKHPLGS